MKIFCLLIGYLFGCVLTAELVTKYQTGKSAYELGSGNPGMANMARSLGMKAALITLVGDILKTAAAIILCRYLLFPDLGRLAFLYGGCGVVLGHGFPFWHRFRGGKSVTVTCTWLILLSPLWGVLAAVAGLATTVFSGYLAVGALVIPTLFLIPAFLFYGSEAGWVVFAATAVLFFLHREPLKRIFRREEPKTDFSAKFRR